MLEKPLAALDCTFSAPTICALREYIVLIVADSKSHYLRVIVMPGTVLPRDMESKLVFGLQIDDTAPHGLPSA
jgi:hypothetical protein